MFTEKSQVMCTDVWIFLLKYHENHFNLKQTGKHVSRTYDQQDETFSHGII